MPPCRKRTAHILWWPALHASAPAPAPAVVSPAEIYRVYPRQPGERVGSEPWQWEEDEEEQRRLEQEAAAQPKWNPRTGFMRTAAEVAEAEAAEAAGGAPVALSAAAPPAAAAAAGAAGASALGSGAGSQGAGTATNGAAGGSSASGAGAAAGARASPAGGPVGVTEVKAPDGGEALPVASARQVRTPALTGWQGTLSSECGPCVLRRAGSRGVGAEGLDGRRGGPCGVRFGSESSDGPLSRMPSAAAAAPARHATQPCTARPGP